ncbi:MAG: GIY-YIG nuclease family protein [Anaerolineae bacterium]|nr:GIY-YIG nuclease family protein [Anaerolineae bacterium]NUQ04499.1 GIY-YIG nuclease family protein [Anaerolineae bacterium]
MGSAFGPGGLRGRLAHHLAPVRKPHWHIDYLRQAATCREVWSVAGEASREHAWAAALLATPGASTPAPRFGASDCACPTHLIHFAVKPDLTALLDP